MSQTLRAKERLAAMKDTIVPSQGITTEHPPFPYPVENSTTSFWRIQLHELDSHRTTPDLPTQCDVLIIGAGFCGAATTYHLLDENPSPPSIVILEAREACSGATGRNGGHCKPDVYFNLPKYRKMFGDKAAAELGVFEASQVYAVKDLVEKEKIDCDFTLTRAADACLDEAHAKKIKKEFDNLVASQGFPSTRDVQYAEGLAAEMLSGVKGAKGAFGFTAAHLWPYKLVMHLLSQAVKKGVNLQTHTPVLKVSDEQDADGRWTVFTARDQVKAKQIVYATNAYTSSILPAYKDKIVPVRGICSRITVPEGKVGPYLPSTHSVRYRPGIYDYQIARPDGSIIVGGARATFVDKLDEWYNVTDDSSLISPAVPHFENLMQRTYRGWEDSGAKLDRIWTGIMGYTADLLPHIGEVPKKPGQYVCAGFNGHGMPQILLASKGVVKMIREGCGYEETGMPMVFKTTEERLASKLNAILDVAPQ